MALRGHALKETDDESEVAVLVRIHGVLDVGMIRWSALRIGAVKHLCYGLGAM